MDNNGTSDFEVVTMTVAGGVVPPGPAFALNPIGPLTVATDTDFTKTVSAVNIPAGETVSYYAYTFGNVDHDNWLSALDKATISQQLTRNGGDILPTDSLWDPEMNLDDTGTSAGKITRADADMVDTLIAARALTLPADASMDTVSGGFTWTNTAGLTVNDVYKIIFVAKASGGAKAVETVAATVGSGGPPVPPTGSIAITPAIGSKTVTIGTDLALTVPVVKVNPADTVTYYVYTRGDINGDNFVNGTDSSLIRTKLTANGGSSIAPSNPLWDPKMDLVHDPANEPPGFKLISEADAAIIDTWVAAGGINTLPPGTFINPSTGAFTWNNTLGLTAGDIYYATFLVVDNNGTSDFEVVTVTIAGGGPGAPGSTVVIEQIDDQTIIELQPFTYSVRATSTVPISSYSIEVAGNIDGDMFLSGLDIITIQTLGLPIEPADSDWDPEMNIDEDALGHITTLDTDLMQQWIDNGETIIPTGPNGPVITPNEVVDTDGDNVPDAALFTWAPAAGQAGVYHITIVAVNADGNKDAEIVTFNVRGAGAGSPVVMQHIEDQTAIELLPFTLQVQAASSDPLVPISSYYIRAGGNIDDDAALSDIDVTIVRDLGLPVGPTDSNWDPEMNIDDQGNITTADLNIMQRWILAREIAIPTDPNDPNAPRISNTGRFTWTPKEGQAGNYHITFVATNADGNKDAEVVNVTVRGASFDAPVLTIPDPKPKTIEERQTLSFSVLATRNPEYTICAAGNCDTDGNLGDADILATRFDLGSERNNGDIDTNSRYWDPRKDVNNNDLISNEDVNIMQGWFDAGRETLPDGAEMAPNTGLFTWTPAVGQAGTHYITFVATDSQGRMDAEVLEIIVTAAPERNINVTSAHGGYTMRRIPDSIPPDPPYYEGETIEITINPHRGYTFTRWTGDVPGGQDPEARTITVIMGNTDINLTANYNSAPRFTERLGMQEGPEGELLTFTVPIAEDADVPETDLVYSWSNNIPGVDLNAFNPDTRLFTWTPGGTDGDPTHRDYPVTFTVSDGIAEDTQPVTIRITNADEFTLEVRTGHGSGITTPVMPPPPYFQGADTRVTVAATPADDGVSQFHSWTFGADGNGDPPDTVSYPDEYSVSFEMNDNYILNAIFNAPPASVELDIDSPGTPPTTIREGDTITIRLSASDSPDNDPIIYSWASDNNSIDPAEVSFDPINGTFIWTPDENAGDTNGRPYPVTFTAADSYASAQSSVSIVVNDRSTYNLDLTVDHGSGTTTPAFPPPPYFQGANTVVSVTAQPNAGSDFVSWTFGDDGNGPVPPGVNPDLASISNLEMSASYMLNANFNAPPVFGNLVVDPVDEGELVEIVLPPVCNDPENDPIVYSWNSDNGSIDPADVSFDPIDGRFSWTTDENDSGSHPVTFTATDSYDASAQRSVNIVVNDRSVYTLEVRTGRGSGTTTPVFPPPPYFQGANTVVSVTAQPNAGSDFVSWTFGDDGNGPVPPGVNPDLASISNLEMSASYMLNANFNAPPVFGNLVVDPVDEGELVEIVLPPVCNDPENDPIVYSWNSDNGSIDPADVSFDPIDGRFSWTTDENDSGSHPVTFTATDSYDASAQRSVNIVVSDSVTYNLNVSVGRGNGTVSDPLPPPPYFRNAPPVSVFISAIPADGFVFDRWDGLPNGMDVSIPDIDLVMNDDFNLVANFNVEAGTHRPSIDSLSPNSGNFGYDQQYTFRMEMSDGDGADNLKTVEVYIGPVSTNSFLLHYHHQDKTFDIVDPSGTRHVGNADSNDILSGTLGKIYCRPSTYSVDPNNPNDLTVTWVMSFNTALSAGMRDVHVLVNDVDGRNSGMQDMGDLRIGGVPHNAPPVLSSVGPKNAEEGVLLSFPVSATDADGDTLGYYVYVAGDFNHDNQVTGAGGDQGLLDSAFGKSEGQVGWNPECDLDNSGTIDFGDVSFFGTQIGKSMPPSDEMDMGETSGVFSWTPADGYAGENNMFTILVTDGNGAYDAEAIVITVAESTNNPPSLAHIEWEMAVQEGMPLIFTATATDDGPAGDLRYYVYAAGDLNHNGVCERGEDETIFNNAGLRRGDANWNPECDMVLKDGQITQGDRNFFAGCLRWGKRVPINPDPNHPDHNLMHPTSGVFQWTPAAGDAPDRFLFIAVVVDGLGARDAQAFTVDVTRLPAPPRIAALTKAGESPRLRPEPGQPEISFTIESGQLLDVFALTGSYNGSADHTVRRATGDTTVPAPVNFTMTQESVNGGRFAWTPTSANENRTYRFTVVATNDIGEDTLTFSVSVTQAAPPPPTPAPRIVSMEKYGLPTPKYCPFAVDSGPYWSVFPARNDQEPNDAANTISITITTESHNSQATHDFRITGDLDGDVVLEVGAGGDDMVRFNQAFGSTRGDANWNPEADFNNDGMVNSADRTFLGSRADDDAVLRGQTGINALRFNEHSTLPCGAYLSWRPSVDVTLRTYYFTVVATDDHGKDAHSVAVYIPGGDTPDFPDDPGSGPGQIIGIRHNGVVHPIPDSSGHITFTHPEDATLEFDVLVGESTDPVKVRARLAGDWKNHNRIIDQDERDDFPSRNGQVVTPYRPEIDFDNSGVVDGGDYDFVERRYGENSLPRPRCKSVNKAGTFTWTPIGIADEPGNNISPWHDYYFTIIVYTRLEITDAYTIKVSLTEATGQDPHYPGRKLPSSSPQITGFKRLDSSEGTNGTFHPRPDAPGEIVFTFPNDRTLAFDVETANFDDENNLRYKVHLTGDQDGDGEIDSMELLHGNWDSWKQNGGYSPQLDFNNNRILDNDRDDEADGDDFWVAWLSATICSATGRKPFTGEDKNNNGVLDPGEDTNGNRVLDHPTFNIDSDGTFTWTPRPGFSSDHRGHLFTVIVTSTSGERDAYTFKVMVTE